MADVITLNEIEEIKGFVKTDNTADSTGTISQKLTHLSQQIGTLQDDANSGTLMSKLNTLLSVNPEHGAKIYSTAGTYTWKAPAGIKIVYVAICGGCGGGGGGGGGYGSGRDGGNMPAGGGGSGGTSDAVFAMCNVTPNNDYTVIVGAGGAGGAGGTGYESSSLIQTDGTSGSAGGYSKFGNYVRSNGGSGGTGGKKGIDKPSSGTNSAFFGASCSSGGGAGVFSTSSMMVPLNMIKGASGKGKNYSDSPSYNYYTDGIAGGASVSTMFGKKSGAGGAGGYGSRYYKGYVDAYNGIYGAKDGTAGSKGDDGYIVLIW